VIAGVVGGEIARDGQRFAVSLVGLGEAAGVPVEFSETVQRQGESGAVGARAPSPGPSVNAVVPSTKASRGQAFRCTRCGKSCFRLARRKQVENAIWLAFRADRPAMRKLPAAIGARAPYRRIVSGSEGRPQPNLDRGV
jgi:hypothetical protein